MKVKQLIEALSKLPQDHDVFVAERKTEFGYGLVNSVYVEKVGMREDPDSEDLCKVDVVVIDEE